MLSVISTQRNDLLMSTSNIYLRLCWTGIFWKLHNLCFMFHFLAYFFLSPSLQICIFQSIYAGDWIYRQQKETKMIITLSEFFCWFFCAMPEAIACCEHQPIWIFVSIFFFSFVPSFAAVHSHTVSFAWAASATTWSFYTRQICKEREKNNQNINWN